MNLFFVFIIAQKINLLYDTNSCYNKILISYFRLYTK